MMTPAHGTLAEAATMRFVAVDGEHGDWAMYAGPHDCLDESDKQIADWGIKLPKFMAMVISEWLFDRNEYRRRWFNMEYCE